MQWCFIHGEEMVRCSHCLDFFAVDTGMDPAGTEYREGREAVMPDGRPIRSIEEIVQNASIHSDCEV